MVQSLIPELSSPIAYLPAPEPQASLFLLKTTGILSPGNHKIVRNDILQKECTGLSDVGEQLKTSYLKSEI